MKSGDIVRKCLLNLPTCRYSPTILQWHPIHNWAWFAIDKVPSVSLQILPQKCWNETMGFVHLKLKIKRIFQLNSKLISKQPDYFFRKFFLCTNPFNRFLLCIYKDGCGLCFMSVEGLTNCPTVFVACTMNLSREEQQVAEWHWFENNKCFRLH